MTQVKKRKRPTKVSDIPVVPASKMRAKLRRRIKLFERRYEMSTEKMREVVRKDPLRETNGDLQVADGRTALLEDLAEMEKSTAGSPLDRYIAIHRGALERHAFVLEDRTVLQQVSRPSGPRLTVEGHILCRGRVVVEVTKGSVYSRQRAEPD